jgi:uncharacterized protein (TIGR03086 family)
MTETPILPNPGAIDDLESVLHTTGSLLAGVTPEMASRPTPCDELDVAHLVDHVLTWSHDYAARVAEEPPAEPDAAGRRRAADFGTFGDAIVAGYRAGTPGAQQLPVEILLMDYLGHGWDLAVATGQPTAFPESASVRALAAAQQMLTPEMRGDSFGPPVVAPDDAGALDRLVAFLGRDPGWSPAQP